MGAPAREAPCTSNMHFTEENSSKHQECQGCSKHNQSTRRIRSSALITQRPLHIRSLAHTKATPQGSITLKPPENAPLAQTNLLRRRSGDGKLSMIAIRVFEVFHKARISGPEKPLAFFLEKKAAIASPIGPLFGLRVCFSFFFTDCPASLGAFAAKSDDPKGLEAFLSERFLAFSALISPIKALLLIGSTGGGVCPSLTTKIFLLEGVVMQSRRRCGARGVERLSKTFWRNCAKDMFSLGMPGTQTPRSQSMNA